MEEFQGEKTRTAVRKARIKPLRLPMETGAGASTQPVDEDVWAFTPEDAIQPPEDFEALAHLTQLNRVRRSCIVAIVTNTVGLGYDLVPKEDREDEVKDDLVKEARARIEACAARDERLHNPDFTTQISAVKHDEQEVGNGYLEVSRNKVTGEIDGFFHVIGKRVRRTQDRKGWIVGPRDGLRSEMTRYIDFGKKVEYDDDGKPKAALRSQADWPEGLPRRWGINELIPFQLYTSESRDYGLPPDSQLAVDYLGDHRAADANAGFFDGSGVPPTVIFVRVPDGEGDESDDGFVELELDAEVITAIGDTLRATSDLRRRVAVIPLPESAEVDVQQLAQRADRDIGFVEFRKDNRRAALGAYRLAPIFVADIEDTNYATAETERIVTKEQVFDGEQNRTAMKLTRLLADLGYPMLVFKFNEMEVKGDKEKRESADALADRKIITRREYRKAHGYEALPEAQEGDEDPEPGQVPKGWNDELVDATTGAAVPDPEEETPPEEEEITGETVIKQGIFEEAVDEAIHRVSEVVGPEFVLNPVVMEKEGDKLVISPYRNGDGS
jgi:capsid portal protein